MEKKGKRTEGKGREGKGREGKKGYYPQKQQAEMKWKYIRKYRQKRREEK